MRRRHETGTAASSPGVKLSRSSIPATNLTADVTVARPPAGAAEAVSRLPALTGLRFLAALAVVLLHVGGYVPSLRPLLSVTGLGYTGVGFFFVLSGFVLAWAGRARPGSAWTFYRHRFARVWPLHVLTTLIATLPIITLSVESPAYAFPVVVLLLQSWFPQAEVHYAYNPVSWSLSCEAFFYLLFPLLALGLGKLGRRGLARTAAMVLGALVAGALAVVRLAPASDWVSLPYINPLFRLGEFVLGICCAYAIDAGWRSPIRLRTALLLTLVLYGGLLALVHRVYDGDPLRLPFGVAGLVLLPGFLLVLCAAAQTTLEGRHTLFASPGWVRLGEWSFALYLIHVLVLRAVGPFVSTDPWIAAVQIIGAMVVAVALAGLLHVLVERPCESVIRGRRRPVERIADPPAAPDALRRLRPAQSPRLWKRRDGSR